MNPHPNAKPTLTVHCERRNDWRVYVRTPSGGHGECLHLAKTKRECTAFIIWKYKENP